MAVPIVNLEELEFQDHGDQKHFQAECTFSHFGRIEDAVGYWEDER